MSTANFELNELIDNYIYISNEAEPELRDYDEDAELVNFVFAYNRVQSGAKKKIKPLEIFKLDLSSGYYNGLIIKLGLQGIDSISPEYILSEQFDNDDSKYYFGKYKSVVQRKAIAEVNKINKRILPYIAEQSAFRKINLIGTFSNGEHLYEYATN